MVNPIITQNWMKCNNRLEIEIQHLHLQFSHLRGQLHEHLHLEIAMKSITIPTNSVVQIVKTPAAEVNAVSNANTNL